MSNLRWQQRRYKLADRLAAAFVAGNHSEVSDELKQMTGEHSAVITALVMLRLPRENVLDFASALAIRTRHDLPDAYFEDDAENEKG